MYKSTEDTALSEHGSSKAEKDQKEDGHVIEVTVTSTEKLTANKVSNSKITGRMVLSLTGATMGSLQFGYNLGVINAPESLIKDFINETQYERTGLGYSETSLTNLWALTVAIFSVGGCFGGLSAGWWATKFGRKGGSLLNIIIGVVASILMWTSKSAGSFEMIIIGRLLIGAHCGLYTGLVPLYLSEVSTPNIRGGIGVLNQLGITVGMLIAQILGFPVLLGTDQLWDTLLGLSLVPCVLQAIILPCCPESPRYLFITKGDEDVSRKVLTVLRGTSNVDEEIEEMKGDMAIGDKQLSIVELFQLPSLRQPILIGVVMQLSQQFSGINGVFFYSTSLFEDAGLDIDTATYTSSAVGAIMVVMTLITVPLMDKVGRRTLHLTGLCGMLVLSILVTITLSLRDKVDWFVEASIVLVLLYVMFFALGPGSIPWLIISELFSHNARPAALSVCVLMNWVASFCVGYVFTLFQDLLNDYVFLPFTALLILFVAFTFFKVPETKGKTFEEITAIWRKNQ